MKYQIGDKIIVLLTEEDGKIIDIISDEMVLIEVRGVKFPAYMDQIDFPYFKQFLKERGVEKDKLKPKPKLYLDHIPQEKNHQKIIVAKGVWISFFPIYDKDIFDDDVVESMKLYLVNQTSLGYKFDYNLFKNGIADFTLQSEVLPMNDFYIHTIPFEDMSDAPRFVFEFVLIKPQKSKEDYFEANFKWKNKQLIKHIEDSRINNIPFFSQLLFEKFPDKELIENFGFVPNKSKFYDIKELKNHLEPARSVVDLHIEKLVEQPEKMKNDEKLDFQLTQFEKYFQLAKSHQLKSIIFIHGVGTGKLRDEIHSRLNSKSRECHFFYGYQSKYGMGATEVFLG